MPRNADSNLDKEKFRCFLLQKTCFDKQICCSGEYGRHKQESVWQKPEIKAEKGDEESQVCLYLKK